MQDLKERTFLYAVSVGKLIPDLPLTVVNKAYSNKLIRYPSSVGANYCSAKRGKSTADFINKLKIVEEEADESIYFLELLKEFNAEFAFRIDSIINEGTEILKIIVASINTGSNKMQK